MADFNGGGKNLRGDAGEVSAAQEAWLEAQVGRNVPTLLTDLSDFPTITDLHIGHFLRVKSDGSGIEFAEIAASTGGVTAHSLLTGLANDDHTHYHTDARALTWLGTRSTADLPEGSNLYYTATRFNTAFAAKTTADLTAAANKNYVTDAQLTVIQNTSGTNTGNQTIVLTGDVTGTGTGSFATTIKTSVSLTTPVIVTSMTLNAGSIITDTTTGLIIGTSTTQKIGFFNATPIVKGTAFTQTYATASHTHANVTSADFPAGGTGAAAGGWSSAANRDLAISRFNALRVDVANVKNTLNGLIDDLQALGLIA